MGFWDKVVPAAPTTHVRQEPVAAPLSVPWYQQGIPTPPAYQQPQTVPQQQAGLELIEGEMLDPTRFRKAEHMRQNNGSCPGCGSDTAYSRPKGMPNAMMQCYLCGYNPRFGEQSGSVGMPDSNTGPAQPARQLSTANNFNPQTVIAKVTG